MTTQPSKILETFPNPAPHRNYLIHMEIPEFTCLCPKTGQPDFGTLIVDFIPDKSCVELKSLKLYIWSFRNEGCFHEAVTNRILDDLAKAAKPRFMRITARFFVRGGIFTNIVAEHRKKGWKPAPTINLAEFSTNSTHSSTRG
jgi:7-cyano-7-deazaguanine reductase